MIFTIKVQKILYIEELFIYRYFTKIHQSTSGSSQRYFGTTTVRGLSFCFRYIICLIVISYIKEDEYKISAIKSFYKANELDWIQQYVNISMAL